jgi:hypothetical protein
MSLQVVNRGSDGLIRRTLVEWSFSLLSARPSVAVHVVGAKMVVVDADGLPASVLEGKQDNRVALNWPARQAEPDDDAVDDCDVYHPIVGPKERLKSWASQPPRTD